MLELILKQFVKDHKNTGNPAVRTRYVMVGSVAGNQKQLSGVHNAQDYQAI